MTILGSRENSCINPHVAGGPDKIQKCHELRIDGMGCSNYNNLKKDYDKPRSIRQLFNDVEDPVWDIEDLVSMAKSQHHKFCPYFAATRVLTKDAKLVLCPYNYLVDPQIRKSMEINLSGNVVILDEAHNIEDSCRDAASFTLSLGEMEEGYSNFVEIERVSKEIRPFVTQPDSQQMYDEFIVCYDKLSHLCKNLIEWLCRMADDKHVNDRRNDELCGVWNGPAIHAVMNDSDLPLKKEERMEFSAMLAKIAKPDLDDNPHERSSFQSDNTQEGRRDEKKRIPKPLSKSLAVVEKLLLFLDYFDNHENDYKMCITKKIAQYGRTVTKPIRDEDGYLGKEKREKSDEITVHWWCMSPAVSFRDAVSEARSVILASGTLSPLDTFKSELGIEFQLTMEGAHVIPKEQIYAATVATGPSGYNLRTVYKESVLPEFQDEVGQLILQICRTVCSGVLCFLPSYRLLDAFTNRWRETGLWDDISSLKFIAEEPRFSSDLHSVMENFYSAIKQPSLFGSSCTGALFLAICRGKVSEGLDFNDENARAVITVGIPYPNVKDMQVESKRKFNDDNCQKLGLLSGKQWYEIQAFRALNQALGRCLRHKNDWGALILVDARFSENPSYYCGGLSRWIRENLVCRHYGEFASDLSNFVDRMVMIEKDKNPPSTSESQQSSESSGQESPVFGSSCETTTD